MKWLKKLRLEGFRSLRDVVIEPGPVTVLIGANGSGKSNLLGFFRFLRGLPDGALRSYVAEAGGASRILFRGPEPASTLSWEIEWELPNGGARYAATLNPSAEDRLYFLREDSQERSEELWGPEVSLGVGHSESELAEAHRQLFLWHKTLDGANPVQVPRPPGTYAFHCIVRTFHFHVHDTSPASALRRNARAIDYRYLASDASNLAAYLLFLKQSAQHEGSWKLLAGLVRQVAPFIADLDPVPTNADPLTFRLEDPDGSLDRVTIRLEWVDEQGIRFGVQDLSDGSLRLIALFAALTQPHLPGFMYIDEPELGLHPAALSLFVELVRRASEQCQILLATQSPALINHFSPEEIVVAEREKGETVLRRLDTHSLAIWLEDYNLAQLFDMNILGGRP